MEFEWDEAKREINLEKHDIDFSKVIDLFDGRSHFTSQSAYPHEERYLSTGIVEGRAVTVIWTPRGGKRRLISARRARDAEERAYRELYP
jgi:uncharacterized DUF497 family protein